MIGFLCVYDALRARDTRALPLTGAMIFFGVVSIIMDLAGFALLIAAMVNGRSQVDGRCLCCGLFAAMFVFYTAFTIPV